MLLCIINVHSRSNDHEFNHCCQGLVRQLNHSYFTKIRYFQGSNSLHYKSASEVTTLRRHTNLFIIIIIKKFLDFSRTVVSQQCLNIETNISQDFPGPNLFSKHNSWTFQDQTHFPNTIPGLPRAKPIFQTQFLDFPGPNPFSKHNSWTFQDQTHFPNTIPGLSRRRGNPDLKSSIKNFLETAHEPSPHPSFRGEGDTPPPSLASRLCSPSNENFWLRHCTEYLQNIGR